MKTLEITIRPSAPEDAAAIADVHNDAWFATYRGLIPHGALNRMVARRDNRWWDRVIRKSGAVMVSEIGGSVVGYSTFGRNRSKDIDCAGEIYELYLQPEYQGIGLGTRLFHASRATLVSHGLRECVVWALEDNDNAMRFYSGLGGNDVAEGFEDFDGKRLKKVAFAFRP